MVTPQPHNVVQATDIKFEMAQDGQSATLTVTAREGYPLWVEMSAEVAERLRARGLSPKYLVVFRLLGVRKRFRHWVAERR
jgi:hypothetical protein